MILIVLHLFPLTTGFGHLAKLITQSTSNCVALMVELRFSVSGRKLLTREISEFVTAQFEHEIQTIFATNGSTNGVVVRLEAPDTHGLHIDILVHFPELGSCTGATTLLSLACPVAAIMASRGTSTFCVALPELHQQTLRMLLLRLCWKCHLLWTKKKPSSSEDSASSIFPWRCTLQSQEAEPAGAAALVISSALDQEGPTSPEDTCISGSVVALCFAIPTARTSPTCSATVVPVAVALYFTSSRRRVCSAVPCWHLSTRDRQLIFGSLFPKWRRIPNLLGGQLSHSFTRDERHRPRLSLPEVEVRPFRSKQLWFPASPFPLLVPASTRLLARKATASPCSALWRCSWEDRSNTMASSNSHRTYTAPSALKPHATRNNLDGDFSS